MTRFSKECGRVVCRVALGSLVILASACQVAEEVPETEVPEAGTSSPSAAGDDQASLYVELQAEDFLQLEVDQQGVDVALVLEDPAGQPLVEIDGLLGAAGPELLLWVAETAGAYRIEIKPPVATGYEIRLEPPRPATPRDRSRAMAARSFYRGSSSVIAGELEAAIPDYLQALGQWTELGEDEWRAASLLALGRIASRSGDSDAALEHYQLASELAVSHPLQVRLQNNIGRVYLDREELEPARAHLTAALAGWETLEDRWIRATAANDLGLVHAYLREVSEALELYGEALLLWRELGDRNREAITLLNRGRAFAAQGKTERALEDLEESLKIRQELEEPRAVAVALTGIGQVYRDLGDLDLAMSRFARALELREPDSRGWAVTLVGIGEIYQRRQDPDRALEYFEKALALFRKFGDSRNAAQVMLDMGLIRDADKPEEAMGYYGEAIEFFRTAGDRDREAACLLGFARAERGRGHLDLARRRAEEALEIIEAVRRQPPGGDLRSAYFATKQNYYDFYVDLLMELADQRSDPKYAFRALTASERARARSQLEAVVEGGSGPREDDPLTRREQELRRSIASKQHQITESVIRGDDPGSAAELKREVRALIDEIDDVRGRIRQSNPLYAEITDPRPLTAEQIQQLVLDGNTMLLEYQLGEARSYLWAVTSEALEVFELPPENEIEELVDRGTRLLGASDREEYRYDLEVALSALSDLLLAPIADLLDGQQLLIVAEGSLQYLPFAALPSPTAADGGVPRPLVADHEITSLPSASWLHFMRRELQDREPPSRDVAVFADPVFRPAGASELPELRASRGEPEARIRARLPDRLINTGLEAEAILGLAENRQNLAALRFNAVKERATGGELRDYRFVHIATHGALDPEFPEQSSLVFSLYGPEGQPRDGFMLTHEIYQLDLLAELVVLSACQTAQGKRTRGEGLTGWTQGFMYSGAKRVIVSLWSVDDEATAELMKQFYTFLLQRQLSPAAALRRAQDAIRRQRQWQAPYFWAPFILQGEYR